MIFKTAATGLATLAVCFSLAVYAATSTDELQEAQQLLKQGQADHALERVDQYLKSRPISSIGAALNAPADRTVELREEARARLLRHRQERLVDRAPSNLLQITLEQKYAFVVDTSKYTMYVFENRNGTWHIVHEGSS